MSVPPTLSDCKEDLHLQMSGVKRAANFTLFSSGFGNSHSECTTWSMDGRQGQSCLFRRPLPALQPTNPNNWCSTRPTVHAGQMTLMSRSENAGDRTNRWKQQRASECMKEERRNSRSCMKKQRVGTGLAFSKTKQIILVELVKKINYSQFNYNL